LVCDAGTPLISDPGFYLVRRAIEANIPLIPIPGPSSVLTALCVSGLPTDRFIFEGFVPRKPGAREKFFQNLKEETGTIIVFETQHRILNTLQVINTVMGNRHIVVTRELTKFNEEILRGEIQTIGQQLKGKPIKGEITLLIQGLPQRKKKATGITHSNPFTHLPSE
jgi:16S rRNA (cytidine1402-2'-O)-methyltransferase